MADNHVFVWPIFSDVFSNEWYRDDQMTGLR